MRIRTAVLSAFAVAALATVAACSSAADPASENGIQQVQQAGAGQAGVAQFAAPQQAGAIPAAAHLTDATDGSGGTLRTITAVGTGTVSGTPDTLTVQLGVQNRASTASAALQQNNTAATKLIKTLQSAGVAKKDLQTSDLSIYPDYSSNGSKITGYEVSNMVSATLHNVGGAGKLIDAAQKAAGNAVRVNGISFSFADDSTLRAQARANAVKQALAQAKQLADAAGVAVGQVLSISDAGSPGSPTPIFAAMPASAAGAESTPVLAGSADLTVNVQVVVAIG